MKYIIAILLLLSASVVSAKGYYVSNGGSDMATGLTPATAWQTIGKINSFTFAANDSIYFQRNGIFYGGILARRVGLNFDAYGSGNKPIIFGLSTITGWVNLGGNIWEAPTTGVNVSNNLVLRNSVIEPVGRFPNPDAANKGWLVNTATTVNTITGPALSTTTNWTGAEVAIRFVRWDITHPKVTSHVGGVVGFTAFGSIPKPNFGYFFQRDPRTLDQDGEWWQDGTNNKLRMYFANNNPNAYTIQAATVDVLLTAQFGNLSVSNLSFYGSGTNGIKANPGASGFTIKNCDFNMSGDEALTINSANNVLIDNCTTKNSLGSGIRVLNNNGGNLIVQNCWTDGTSFIAGMESNDANNGGLGILIKGATDVKILKNRVTNSGYNGIEWQGNNVLVNNNFVQNFCSVRDDGGGIYTVECQNCVIPVRRNRVVSNNIIVDGSTQATAGAPSGAESAVVGLYFDLGTRSVTADGNTMSNIPGNAMHGNNNDSLTIINNTTHNTKYHLSFQRFPNEAVVRGMRIVNNIFHPYRIQYRNLSIDVPALTKEADLLAWGRLDSNYYSTKSPGIDTSIRMVTTTANGLNFKDSSKPFTYLTGTVGIETHSTNVSNNGNLEYNASDTVRAYLFPGRRMQNLFGATFDNVYPIPRWGSVILIDIGAVPVPIPPTANAGADKSITLPTTTTNVSGSGTTGSGASITYLWSQISGPSTASITTQTLANTNITNLTNAGTYTFKLKATTNLGDTASDFMQVVVNTAPIVLPTANAGVDKSITLPTTSTSATATATLGSGSLVSYTWVQTGGPATATFGSGSSLTTTINSLTVAGTYSFKFTVLNSQGNSASDNMDVIVSPAIPPVNIPPTAVAGVNQTITLPTNTATVNGSGSSDPDGTITNYDWTITGPNTPTNSTPTSVSTTFGSLIAGSYQARLSVTDNNGDTGVATLTITVNPQPNVLPTANAGSDVILTLPTNSTTLDGSGSSDPDGITAYFWRQISGPSIATNSNVNSVTNTVSNTVQGVYIYQLKVTGSNGSSDTAVDAVQITVNSTPVNNAPIANAGPDRTITLPLDSVVLVGSGTDVDGEALTYIWKDSTGATIGTTATITINFLTQIGYRDYTLTVIDTHGATGTDTVRVATLPAPSQQRAVLLLGVKAIFN